MERLTARLRLREFISDDWHAVYRYQASPENLRFTPFAERAPADVQTFVQRFIDWQSEVPRRRFQFAVELQESPQLIGTCGLRCAADDTTADIGYELGHRYWGQGYGTELAQEMLRFGFTEFNLAAIWAWCYRENVASSHILMKIGMRYTGSLPEDNVFKGRTWLKDRYEIGREEWLAHIG
jgi:ribosomal-protein-alanine N-acetyltransferase